MTILFSYEGSILFTVNFSVIAAPPTNIGISIPASRRTATVFTISAADFTRSPESPTKSAFSVIIASLIFSAGVLIPRSITLYPLFPIIIPTRFFPISWTSPLTVAIITVPFVAESDFSINCSKCETEAFITSALWRTSATIRSFLLKSLPTSSIPVIRGPFIISSGAYFSSSLSSRGTRSFLLPSTTRFAICSSGVMLLVSAFFSTPFFSR